MKLCTGLKTMAGTVWKSRWLRVARWREFNKSFINNSLYTVPKYDSLAPQCHSRMWKALIVLQSSSSGEGCPGVHYSQELVGAC